MSDLILHRYPMSPFAEKIRMVPGHKRLDWQSVHIPVVMPKSDLVAATRVHFTIRRTDARAGNVHVHFPRIGYALRAVAPR